jgi:hypothetical protein
MRIRVFHEGSTRFVLLVALFASIGLAVLAMLLNRDLVGTGVIIGTLLGSAVTGKVFKDKSEINKNEVEDEKSKG